MNTKKEIVKFLEELAEGVQGKVEYYRQEVGKYTGTKEKGLFTHFKEQLADTDARLYEINYILSKITRDHRKKY